MDTSKGQQLTKDVKEARSRVSLEELIRQTLERNPSLRAAHARTEGMRSRIPQARAWDDPQFAFEFYQTPVTSLNPLKDGMENDYSLQQMIHFPGKKSLMGDMAAWNARMTESSASAIRLRLVTDVISTHAMLYAAQQRQLINRQTRETIRRILEAMNVRYSAGVGSQADILAMQTELEKARLEETRIEQERLSAEAMMNALRAMPHGETVGEVDAPTLQPPPVGIELMVADALHLRPELAGMTAEIEMNKTDRSLRRLERAPDFMVRGMYKQMLMDLPDYWSLMIGVNIPIAPWSSGKYSGRIEEAEANLLAAEQSYRDMAVMVEFEVRDAWLRSSSLWSQLERYRTALLPVAEQALQSSLARFQTDAAEFRGLLDAVRMLEMYGMEQAMLEGDYLSSLAKLNRAMGFDPSADDARHTEQ